MFYDTFVDICSQRRITPAQVRKDLGISQSTMASWKSRGLTPNATTLARMSDYFGVSISYLIGESDQQETLGQLISRLRHEKELSAARMSTATEIPLGRYLGIELGGYPPTEEEFDRISNALGVHVSLLRDCPFSPKPKVSSRINDVIESIVNETRDGRTDSQYDFVSDAISRVDAAFTKLNDEGIEEAVKRVEELTEIPKYQRTANPPEPTTEPPEDKK